MQRLRKLPGHVGDNESLVIESEQLLMTVHHNLFWDLPLYLLTIGNASIDSNFPNGFQTISVTDDVKVQLQVVWDLGSLGQALSDLVLLREGDIINQEYDILSFFCPNHLLNIAIQLCPRD